MTELLYLHDSTQIHATAHVIDTVIQDDKKAVLLDKTIFYPQGGGQPSDQGTISSSNGTFTVTDARYIDGNVYHFGSFTQGSFAPGEAVELTIDTTRRTLNSRIHSAGHLIDEAVIALEYDLKPGKGYHFPEGSYVEYEGVLPEDEREEAVTKLQEVLDSLVEQDLPIKTRVAEGSKQTVGGGVAAEKPLRFVQIGQGQETPCGGTHVAHTKELGRVVITKVKCKGGKTRISYTEKVTQ